MKVQIQGGEFTDWRSAIEHFGDQVESVARAFDDEMQAVDNRHLCALAWQLKQVARRRTPSEGV